jgi:hypothetical protein
MMVPNDCMPHSQVWDVRNPTTAPIRHSAHNALVLAVQYHPQWADVIASGGRDTLVKVARMAIVAVVHV